MALFDNILRGCIAGAMIAGLFSMPLRAEPITFSGEYYFYTFVQKDGRPICSERWLFKDDGTLTIYSAQEAVTQRFSVETDDKSSFLISRNIQTNGLPDCLGRTYRSEPTERRDFIYRAADGDVVLCRPPAAPSPGVIPVLDCYARLIRAPDGDQPPISDGPMPKP